jgi:glycosyltransferase involved in cell wall biosynthesis
MKKKIMILGKIPPPFMGPSIATQIILNSSLKNKYELIHIDTRVNTDLTTMGKFSIAKIFKSVSIWWQMLIKIITKRPSLVIIPISQSTGGYLKDLIFILIAKCTFRKTLVHLRGSNFLNWLNNSSVITSVFVKATLKLNNGVIVLGNNLRYLFAGIFPEKNIYVSANGGNYTFPARENNNKRISILYLANLQPSKGIEDLIEAVRLLKGTIEQNYSLEVVGSWRSKAVEDRCKEIVSVNDLPIRFHPSASGEKKFGYFANADIFVFTPREPEGHPWVIVEAMAAGLPIISTDQGAIIESVKDGENGFIVPVADPSAIAGKLKMLIVDKSLRERMSRSSRTNYENGFTEEKMVDHLSEIFETVIAA